MDGWMEGWEGRRDVLVDGWNEGGKQARKKKDVSIFFIPIREFAESAYLYMGVQTNAERDVSCCPKCRTSHKYILISRLKLWMNWKSFQDISMR